GPDMPGIGFGVSIERILLALKTQEVELPITKGLDCYVVSMGEETEVAAFGMLDLLRSAGIKADKDYLSRKMKAQMKSADRENSRYVILIGEDELAKNVANVKDLATGQQEEVPMNEVTEYVKARL
ncbi:MAG: His/Gly/Thr/Pro-type tRNA ligase C-terminal domain-containing protein, partial [Bacilli bacterium]